MIDNHFLPGNFDGHTPAAILCDAHTQPSATRPLQIMNNTIGNNLWRGHWLTLLLALILPATLLAQNAQPAPKGEQIAVLPSIVNDPYAYPGSGRFLSATLNGCMEEIGAACMTQQLVLDAIRKRCGNVYFLRSQKEFAAVGEELNAQQMIQPVISKCTVQTDQIRLPSQQHSQKFFYGEVSGRVYILNQQGKMIKKYNFALKLDSTNPEYFRGTPPNSWTPEAFTHALLTIAAQRQILPALTQL